MILTGRVHGYAIGGARFVGGLLHPRRADLERRDTGLPAQAAHSAVESEVVDAHSATEAASEKLDSPASDIVRVNAAVEIAEPLQVGFRETVEVIHGRPE